MRGRPPPPAPSACLGEFLFYLRRVSGSNSTALPSRASDQPCGLSLSAQEIPTTGSSSLSGGFPFLSAACEWVEQHGPDKECSGNVNHPHLPDRMVYRSGNGAVHFLCGSFCFLSAAPLRVPVVPFCLIPLPQRSVFARCICGCSAARLFREWLSVLPKRRTPARKKRRNAVPTIYSAVSYRFYNVFYKKDFTNEF